MPNHTCIGCVTKWPDDCLDKITFVGLGGRKKGFICKNCQVQVVMVMPLDQRIKTLVINVIKKIPERKESSL